MNVRNNPVILHISDIQFGKYNRISKKVYPKGKDPVNWFFNKLNEDLSLIRNEYSTIPNIIVVSGDIAEWGLRKEYHQAKKFLLRICKEFKIKKDRVVIVPGNHDINRKDCENYFNKSLSKGEKAQIPYYPKYNKFESFFNDFYDGSRSFEKDSIQLWDLEKEFGIFILGLDSCEKDSHRRSDHYGWISEEKAKIAINKMKNQLRDTNTLKVVVFHHNLFPTSKNDKDGLRNPREIIRILLENDVDLVLHGHEHQTEAIVHGNLGGSHLSVVATGSLGLSHSALKEQQNKYCINLIDILGNNEGYVILRRFDPVAYSKDGTRGRWISDGTLPQAPYGVYSFKSKTFTGNGVCNYQKLKTLSTINENTSSIELGLNRYIPEFKSINFYEEYKLLKPHNVDICNTYGGTWLRYHANLFVDMVKDDVDLRVCFVAPRGMLAKTLDYKYGTKSGKAISIINDSINTIKQIVQNSYSTKNKSSIKVYGTPFGINYTFYRFDDTVFYAPLPNTVNKFLGAVPVLQVKGIEDPSLGGWIMRDFEILIKRNAKLLFSQI